MSFLVLAVTTVTAQKTHLFILLSLLAYFSDRCTLQNNDVRLMAVELFHTSHMAGSVCYSVSKNYSQ